MTQTFLLRFRCIHSTANFSPTLKCLKEISNWTYLKLNLRPTHPHRKTHSSCNVLISASGISIHIHARNLRFILDTSLPITPTPKPTFVDLTSINIYQICPLLSISTVTRLLSLNYQNNLLPGFHTNDDTPTWNPSYSSHFLNLKIQIPYHVLEDLFDLALAHPTLVTKLYSRYLGILSLKKKCQATSQFGAFTHVVPFTWNTLPHFHLSLT